MSESRQRAWQALDIGPEWRLRGQPGTAVAPGPEGTQAGAEQDGHVRDGNTVHGDGSPAGLGWAGLREAVAGCRLCTLCETRRSTVFGVGDERAGWMVVGEAPGAEEDRVGEPFVGRAGQLLDNMLAAIGLDRTTAYIANILKCRPPDNRDPQAGEVAACEPYLQRQIALIRPRLILAVGRIAAQNLLKTDLPLARLRGRIHHYGPQRIPLIVTYHPAYLLRTPADKRKAWEDLQLAVRVFRDGDVVGGGQ